MGPTLRGRGRGSGAPSGLFGETSRTGVATRDTNQRGKPAHVGSRDARDRLAGCRPVPVIISPLTAGRCDDHDGRAATTRSLVGLLRSIYAAVVLDRLVPFSPVVRIALPRVERPRVVPLTVAQVAALANAMPDRYRSMVITQAGLGRRTAGSARGRRRLPRADRPGGVAVHQRKQGALGAEDAPVTPDDPSTAGRPRRDSRTPGHLPGRRGRGGFTTTMGTPLGHVYYGHNLFRKAVVSAGLPEGTTSHDLRHHFASLLLAAGESVIAVAERLGHDDASLVLSTYGHLMPDSEDRTRRAVDAAWGAAAAACAPDVPQGVRSVR